MAERWFFDDWIDWALHVVTFGRSRLDGIGDAMLYRPGLWSFHLLQDYFFRVNFALSGFSSFLQFSSLATALYWACRKHLSPLLAVGIILLFVTLPTNQTIVGWRHITPYLLAFPFAFAACNGMGTDVVSSKTRWFTCFLILIISMSFHDAIAVAMCVAIALGGYFVATGGARCQKTDLLMLGVAGGAVLIYYAGSLIEYWWLAPDSLTYGITTLESLRVEKHFKLWFVPSSGKSLICQLYWVFAATFRAAFLSFTATHFWEHELVMWRFYQESPLLNAIAFIFGMLILWCSTARLRDCRRANGWSGSDLMAMWSIALIVAVVLGLVLGRGLVRGMGYLDRAGYYWTLTSFCWFYLLGWLISQSQNIKSEKIGKLIDHATKSDDLTYEDLARLKWTKGKAQWFRKRSMFIVVGVVWMSIVAGQASILRGDVSQLYDHEKAARYYRNLTALTQFHKLNPDHCLRANVLWPAFPGAKKSKYELGLNYYLPTDYIYEFVCSQQRSAGAKTEIILGGDVAGNLKFHRAEVAFGSELALLPESHLYPEKSSALIFPATCKTSMLIIRPYLHDIWNGIVDLKEGLSR